MNTASFLANLSPSHSPHLKATLAVEVTSIDLPASGELTRGGVVDQMANLNGSQRDFVRRTLVTTTAHHEWAWMLAPLMVDDVPLRERVASDGSAIPTNFQPLAQLSLPDLAFAEIV